MPVAGPVGFPALEVDVYPARVLLRVVLQPQLAAELLDLGLDLLHVAGRVVALADDGVQVRLAGGLVRADALLEDALRLLDVQAVQVDGVLVHLARRVVGPEDELRGLSVIVVHLGVVGFALLRVLLCAGVVALVVGLAGLIEQNVIGRTW